MPAAVRLAAQPIEEGVHRGGGEIRGNGLFGAALNFLDEEGVENLTRKLRIFAGNQRKLIEPGKAVFLLPQFLARVLRELRRQKGRAIFGELGGIGKTRARAVRQQRERIAHPAPFEGLVLENENIGCLRPQRRGSVVEQRAQIRGGKIRTGTKQSEIEIRFLAAEKARDAKPAIAMQAETEQGGRPALPVLGGDE